MFKKFISNLIIRIKTFMMWSCIFEHQIIIKPENDSLLDIISKKYNIKWIIRFNPVHLKFYIAGYSSNDKIIMLNTHRGYHTNIMVINYNKDVSSYLTSYQFNNNPHTISEHKKIIRSLNNNDVRVMIMCMELWILEIISSSEQQVECAINNCGKYENVFWFPISQNMNMLKMKLKLQQ